MSSEKNKAPEEKKSAENEEVFEISNTKTEQTNKSEKTEKTAADSILERINRLKGEKNEKKDKLIEEFVKKEPRMERAKWQIYTSIRGIMTKQLKFLKN